MHLGMFQAEEFGDLQRLVDGLFTGRETIERLDLIVQAEILDLAPDLLEIVNLVPPGTVSYTHLDVYKRQARSCARAPARRNHARYATSCSTSYAPAVSRAKTDSPQRSQCTRHCAMKSISIASFAGHTHTGTALCLSLIHI